MKNSQRSLAAAQRIGKMRNWELDHQNNKLKWSEEIYRIFGLKHRQSDSNNKAFLSTVHPEDREYVDLAFKNSLASTNHYGIANRIVKRDGKVR